jgi:hypothetical protein
MPVDVSGEPVVLLRSRIWPAVLVPAAMLAGSVAYGVWARQLPCDLLTIFLWRTGRGVRERIEAVLRQNGIPVIDDRGRRVPNGHQGRRPR